MSKYANKTSVSVDRSMGQIRQLLAKGGADGVAIAETSRGAVTQFIFASKPYKFTIFYPDKSNDDIVYTAVGRLRTDTQVNAEIEAEKRRLWRAMVLYIKAAIEAHSNGLIDLKRSLMSNMQLPSGQTVYERIENKLETLDTNPQLLLE